MLAVARGRTLPGWVGGRSFPGLSLSVRDALCGCVITTNRRDSTGRSSARGLGPWERALAFGRRVAGDLAVPGGLSACPATAPRNRRVASLALAGLPLHEADHLVAAGLLGSFFLGRSGLWPAVTNRSMSGAVLSPERCLGVGLTALRSPGRRDDALVGSFVGPGFGREGAAGDRHFYAWRLGWGMPSGGAPLLLWYAIPAAIHLANQALRADPRDGPGALALFRSNRTCGLLVLAAMLVVGTSL